MMYLVLAILSSACISIVMRTAKSFTKSTLGLLATNYCICLVLSLMYSKHVSVHVSMWMLGILNGFLYFFSFVLLQRSIHQNGVILSSTFQKLGIVVPTLLTILVFKEIPRVTQVMGLCMSFLCILILQMEKGNRLIHKPFLLILLLAGSGCGDAMSKIYERVGNALYQDEFLLMTFVFALIFCIGILVYKKEKVSKMDILFGCIIGIPNYYSARFLLKALYTMPSIVVYPMYSVMTILLVSVCGFFLFKEKLQIKQAIAFVLILSSVVLLNI